MIELVERILKRVGIIAPFSDDDVLNASIEDKARDHENLIGRLHESVYRRLATNEHLRESIRIAKKRTNSFEVFEKHLLGRKTGD